MHGDSRAYGGLLGCLPGAVEDAGGGAKWRSRISELPECLCRWRAASGASGSWSLLAGLEQRLAVVAAEEEGEAVQVVA
jgi:hypothetical protein